MLYENQKAAFRQESDNSMEIWKMFFRILRRWHWFAISITLGIILAWLYNHYSPNEYRIRSSLIVNEYESGMNKVNISQGVISDNKVNVFSLDHAGRIKSYMLHYNTIESLGWNISWFEKTMFYGRDLYGNEPYKVTLIPTRMNLTGVPIYISKISDSEFMMDIDATTKIQGEKVTLKFSQRGKFNEPIENEYFGFTILWDKRFHDYKGKLYFVINDPKGLSIEYQKKLKVISNIKKPDIIELVLKERNPQRGVDFLNRLEQTYIAFGLEEKNKAAENAMRFIDSQLRSVTDSLSIAENRFTNFRSRTQTVDLAQEGGLVMQKQESLESERANLESRIEYLNNLLITINDSKQFKQIVVPSLIGISDQTLNGLVSKLSDLYARREVLSFSVREKAPSIVLVDKEIQLTHDLLIQNVNSLLGATQMELDNLIRRSGGFSSQLSLLPRTEQQLSSLKRNFDLNNELYTFLLKLRAESAITYAANQPDVKVLDTADLQTSMQVLPMTMINYFIGLLLGILIPISIIFFNDFVSGSIQTKEEIEELTKLPVAGMIIHNKGKNDLVVIDNPRSNITESFRLLRTNLKYILSGEDKKVIAVQSTIAGEGKSFVSINLASVFAINDLHVLLVGVDMRMSALHNILQSSNKKGISTYLSKQDDFEDIIEKTSIANLDYVPSGPVPPNPAELLENGLFEQFVKKAKLRYDFIILDSPPVSLVTDGIITGRLADVNLFVIRFGYSKKGQLKLINEHSTNKTLPNLALVLNDAIKENFGDGNYYYQNKSKGYYVDR